MYNLGVALPFYPVQSIYYVYNLTMKLSMCHDVNEEKLVHDTPKVSVVKHRMQGSGLMYNSRQFTSTCFILR